jgi:hypothetical protein
VELLDEPLCGADLSSIENIWAETKCVMAENWPDLSENARWDVVLDAWEEVKAKLPHWSSHVLGGCRW